MPWRRFFLALQSQSCHGLSLLVQARVTFWYIPNWAYIKSVSEAALMQAVRLPSGEPSGKAGNRRSVKGCPLGWGGETITCEDKPEPVFIYPKLVSGYHNLGSQPSTCGYSSLSPCTITTFSIYHHSNNHISSIAAPHK